MQTSFAARGVLNRLNAAFVDRNYLFAEFYDFSRGLDPDFNRRLTQVPIAARGEDWVAIMWSRDPESLSLVNKQFTLVPDPTNPTRKSSTNGLS